MRKPIHDRRLQKSCNGVPLLHPQANATWSAMTRVAIFILGVLALTIDPGWAENYTVAGDMESTIRYELKHQVTPGDGVKLMSLSFVVPQTFESPTYSQVISDFALVLKPEPQERKTSTDGRGNRIILATWTKIPSLIEVSLSCNATNKTGLKTLETEVPFPLPPLEPALIDYLKPTAQVQSKDPRIQELAARLTAGAKTELEAVQRVISWVVDNMHYTNPPQQYDALYSLGSGKGNCQNFSHLSAALLRSVGIPVRIVNGVTLNQPFDVSWEKGTLTFKMGQGRHSWIEVLFPDKGWIPCDPQNTQFFVSNRFVRIEVGIDNNETKNDGMLRWAQGKDAQSKPRLQETIGADFNRDLVKVTGDRETYGPQNILLTPHVRAQRTQVALQTPPPAPLPPVVTPPPPPPAAAPPSRREQATPPAPAVELPKAPPKTPTPPAADKPPQVALQTPPPAPLPPVVAPPPPPPAAAPPSRREQATPPAPAAELPKLPKAPLKTPTPPAADKPPQVALQTPPPAPLPPVVAPPPPPPAAAPPARREQATPSTPAAELPKAPPKTPTSPAADKPPQVALQTPPPAPLPPVVASTPPKPYIFGNLDFPEDVDFAFPRTAVATEADQFEMPRNFLVETSEYVTTQLTQYAQQVVLPKSMTLQKIGIAMHNFGGDGWLWVEIYKDNGGQPGSLIATSEFIGLEQISPKPGYRWTDFEFSRESITLVPGDYWIALGFSGSPIVNWFYTYGKPVGPADGTRYKNIFARDWSGALNYEFNYRLMGLTTR